MWLDTQVVFRASRGWVCTVNTEMGLDLELLCAPVVVDCERKTAGWYLLRSGVCFFFFFVFSMARGNTELTTQITQALSAANSSICDLIVTSFRQVYPCVESVLWHVCTLVSERDGQTRARNVWSKNARIKIASFSLPLSVIFPKNANFSTFLLWRCMSQLPLFHLE